jgi:hypothetical protein
MRDEPIITFIYVVFKNQTWKAIKIESGAYESSSSIGSIVSMASMAIQQLYVVLCYFILMHSYSSRYLISVFSDRESHSQIADALLACRDLASFAASAPTERSQGMHIYMYICI